MTSAYLIQFPGMKGLRVDSPLFFINSRFSDWAIGETYTSPAGRAGIPGLVYCLVGAGISSRSITDLTKYKGQAMRSLKYIKSGLSCLFVYQSHQSIVWTMELAINTI